MQLCRPVRVSPHGPSRVLQHRLRRPPVPVPGPAGRGLLRSPLRRRGTIRRRDLRTRRVVSRRSRALLQRLRLRQRRQGLSDHLHQQRRLRGRPRLPVRRDLRRPAPARRELHRQRRVRERSLRVRRCRLRREDLQRRLLPLPIRRPRRSRLHRPAQRWNRRRQRQPARRRPATVPAPATLPAALPAAPPATARAEAASTGSAAPPPAPATAWPATCLAASGPARAGRPATLPSVPPAITATSRGNLRPHHRQRWQGLRRRLLELRQWRLRAAEPGRWQRVRYLLGLWRRGW